MPDRWSPRGDRAPPPAPSAPTLVADGRAALAGPLSSASTLHLGLALTLSAEGPVPSGPASDPGGDLPIIDPSTYEITGEVGQGGIGRVLRACDTRLHRLVAIKELQEAAGAAAEDRFVREALLTARLQHPSIVPLYEAGRWPNGAPFYAMKLVTGRSLLELFSEGQTLDARLALLPHVLAAAEAMAYAHSERIIHRDLKPGNVLVGAFGETVVIDWGLAKDLTAPEDDLPPEPPPAGPSEPTPAPSAPSTAPRSDNTPRGRTPSGNTPRGRTPSGRTPPGEALTMHGAVIGTPAYMPPEQARGEPVGERADVYSIGAILHHLLTGAPPYEGPSAAAALRQVLAGPPRPAAGRQPGIAEDLLAIVNKAMAREPVDRYPTAKELADDLRRFQTGQIVGAHRYSRGQLVRRFARRYRAPLSVALAALAVIAVSGAVAVRRILTESRLAREGQASAQAAERRALGHADDLTLVQAADAVERDPNRALAWLATLSPSFERWPEARLIAADARSRGISVLLPGHTGAVNQVMFTPDGKGFLTASDDHTVRFWDSAGARASRVLAAGVPPGSVFNGHTDEAWGLAISPDGATLASTGKDTTLRFWDLATGTSRVVTTGHTKGVPEVAFAGPDLLLTASDDGTAKLWDVKTGEARGQLGASGQLRSVAVSPDGRHVAGAGYDKQVRVWDLASRSERVFSGHTAPLAGVAFSPDSAWIATRDHAGGVLLWDLVTGSSRVLSPRISPGLFALPPFGKIRFSPDGSQLALAGDGPYVRLWDVGTGAERRLEGPEGKTSWVVFSPDGALVAAASQDHTVRIWDLARGGSRSLSGFAAEVTTVAFSPDGELLAAGGADGAVRLFPVAMTVDRTFEGGAPLRDIDVSPDGEHVLAAASDGTIRVWSLAAGEAELLEGHQGPVQAASFSPDGQLVASGGADGTTRLWTAEGYPLWTAPGRGAGALTVVFSPDGRLVASPGERGQVGILDVDSAARRELTGAADTLLSARFSPDGAQVVGAGKSGAMFVWDLATGEGRPLTGHGQSVLAVTFSPDGRTLASGALDHTLRLWDLAAGEGRKIDAGGASIRQAVFSADGATLFTCDFIDTRVTIWDVAKGARRGALSGHFGYVSGLALSADERRLASSGLDGTVRVWDLASGAARILRGHRGGVVDVAFSIDGERLLSGGADGTVRVWSDDLPEDPAALREWIRSAIPDGGGR